MILKVCKYGEKVLRERAEPVKAVTDALRKTADDMLETMHKAKGVGLAAQQVGRLERMCVIDIPEIGGHIVRAEQVTATYLDENNMQQTITARGFLARALQHEIDHLNGILYIDHMTAVERLSFANKLKKLAAKNGGTR